MVLQFLSLQNKIHRQVNSTAGKFLVELIFIKNVRCKEKILDI